MHRTTCPASGEAASDVLMIMAVEFVGPNFVVAYNPTVLHEPTDGARRPAPFDHAGFQNCGSLVTASTSTLSRRPCSVAFVVQGPVDGARTAKTKSAQQPTATEVEGPS